MLDGRGSVQHSRQTKAANVTCLMCKLTLIGPFALSNAIAQIIDAPGTDSRLGHNTEMPNTFPTPFRRQRPSRSSAGRRGRLRLRMGEGNEHAPKWPRKPSGAGRHMGRIPVTLSLEGSEG